MTDSRGSQRFLIDTGSSYSILPFSSPSTPTGPVLFATDKPRISCWGYTNMLVTFGGVNYERKFLKAKVRFPIIGIDFLRHFKLGVDDANAVLVPSRQRLRLSCNSIANATQPARTAAAARLYAEVAAAAPQQPPRLPPVDSWQAIMAEFPAFTASKWKPGHPAHGVQHTIKTRGQPVTSRFRRLNPECLATARAEFNCILEAGNVRRSSSAWSSPLHMVCKKDNKLRP
jgi:hypothetical protein